MTLSHLAQTLAQGGCDVGVVVSAAGEPLGIVRASQLLGCAIAHPHLFADTLPSGPNEPVSWNPARLADHLDWLEPVDRLPADLPLDALLVQKRPLPFPCVVVDQQQYLGLLDWDSVMRELPPERASSGVSPLHPAVLVAQQLLQDAAAEGLEAAALPESDMLFALLEPIPLAMTIQSGDGRILFCNSAWATQLPLSVAGARDHLEQPTASLTDRALVWRSSQADSEGFAAAMDVQVASLPPRSVADSSGLAWQLIRVPLPLGIVTRGYRRGAPHCEAPASGIFTPPDDRWLVIAIPPEAAPQPVSDLLSTAPKPAWLLELNHELKSPLTSLLGLSTLLQDPRLGSLNPRQTRYARLLHQTVRRLVATVNQLLDWFRLDAGQLILFPTPIRTHEVGPQVLRSLVAQGNQDNAAVALDKRFSWSVEPGLVMLYADPLRLQQMLQHLIGYSLGQSDKPAPFGLQIDQWGDWVALTLWNRSGDLPAHLQRQLFQDRYEPIESSGPPVGRTELGLILTWHLVRLHGGDISVFSSPTRGSQFTLLLPQAPLDPSMVEAAPEAASLAPATALILLACIEGAVIEAVFEALQETRYRVAIARSEAELLDKINRLNPALVLLHTAAFATADPARLQPLVDATAPLIRLEGSLKLSPLAAVASSGEDSLPVHAIAQQLVPLLHRRLSDATANSVPDPPAGLTILHLTELQPDLSTTPPPWALSNWLHAYRCRVLEVDDLSQAEVLSRVWKPHVVLLDPSIPDVQECLSRLAQMPSLKNRPLVTLTPALTQAAQQHANLSIFPCLEVLSLEADRAAAVLMHTIIRAAAQA